jgi:hypothetical protein
VRQKPDVTTIGEGDVLAILYRHTQRVPVVLVIGAAAIALLLLDAALASSWPASANATVFINVVFAGAVLLLWYQSSMTVELTDGELRWHFGPGPVFRVARDEITGVRYVRDPWWGGYGTTLFGIGFFPPNRWTYKVAGHDAVEVRLRRGGWRRLGTDDPQGLLAALISGAH